MKKTTFGEWAHKRAKQIVDQQERLRESVRVFQNAKPGAETAQAWIGVLVASETMRQDGRP